VYIDVGKKDRREGEIDMDRESERERVRERVIKAWRDTSMETTFRRAECI